jgi:hypothetical protein
MREINIDQKWFRYYKNKEVDQAKEYYGTIEKDLLMEKCLLAVKKTINYNLPEKRKEQRIERLEKIFISERDNILNFAKIINNSGTSWYEDENLLEELNSLLNRDKKIRKLADRYSKMFKDKDYSHKSFKQYSVIFDVVTERLYSEMDLRELDLDNQGREDAI